MRMREVTGSGAPEVLHFFRGAGATAAGTAARRHITNGLARSAALSLSLSVSLSSTFPHLTRDRIPISVRSLSLYPSPFQGSYRVLLSDLTIW